MRLLSLNLLAGFIILSVAPCISTSNVTSTTIAPENITTHTSVRTEDVHISVKKWRKVEEVVRKMSATFVKNALPYALQASENLNLSSKCTRGLMTMLNGIKQTKIWAFRMIDASGKIPNGVMSGNINSLGDYEQCLNVEVPNHFRGQYCPVKILPPVPERRPFTSADDELPEFINATRYGLVVSEFMKKAYYYHYLNFRSSVCVPSTCSAEEVQKIAEKVMEMIGIEFDVSVPHCESKEEKIMLSKSEIIIMCVLSLIVFLGITATVTDVILRLISEDELCKEKLSTLVQCLLCFSFYTNTERLLKSDKSSDSIKIFHGFKVITILWVILNHSYLYLNFSGCSALLNAREMGKEIPFQFMANGFLNVETFFFISAVLVSYGVMKGKERKINIFLYIARRLWRLTPPFMLVIAVVYLVPYIGSGPVWKETVEQDLTAKCKANWWTNLIYINNFVPSADMCMQWAWYIPVDTHLYFLSLIVLIPLKRNPRLAFMMNGLLFVSAFIISASLHIYYELHPLPIYVFTNPNDINHFIDRSYFRTYVHVSTYCIGLTVGYILATRQKLKIPWGINLAGWLASFVLSLTVVYGVYDWNQGELPGLAMSTLYSCTHKLVWALAIAWVTISCTYGNGGIATKILSWPAFVPLSRLTYMAYLVHPVIQHIFVGSTKTVIKIEHRTLVFMYLGYVVASFIAAYVFSLLFESPFMALEKVLLSSKKPEKNMSADSCPNTESLSSDYISQYKISNLPEDNGIYAIQIKKVDNND